MGKMRRIFALIVIGIAMMVTGSITGLTANASADLKIKDLQAEHLFKDVKGTLLIKSLKTDSVYAYNLERSKERFTPESTFKVPNALIGLEVKAVEDEYEVKRWDGVVREIGVWNRDHTLASGMRHSAIWFYQALARDIGSERMQSHLNNIHYGNQDISGGIDRFWLNSSLKISAQEQIAFMEKLVEEELPFQEQTMKTVKRIMIDKEADDYTVHGKTGTRLSDLGLGWYVGYVETKQGTWVFAANVGASGSTAKRITLQCLEEMNIVNSGKEDNRVMKKAS